MLWKLKYIGRSAMMIPFAACMAIDNEFPARGAACMIGSTMLLMSSVTRVCGPTVTTCSVVIVLARYILTTTSTLVVAGFCKVRNSEQPVPVQPSEKRYEALAGPG